MALTTRLTIGMQAPDFKLQNQNEEWVSLSHLVQTRGAQLIAFYPGDFTMVCTQQLCAYQEAYDHFTKAGISIIGISHNTPEEHQKFKNRYRFAFDLLSDPGKETAKQWGVSSLFLLGGLSRAVFIVSRNQKILHRYVEPTPLTHRKPDELLRVIDELKGANVL